jgi:hypothetical protein
MPNKSKLDTAIISRNNYFIEKYCQDRSNYISKISSALAVRTKNHDAIDIMWKYCQLRPDYDVISEAIMTEDVYSLKKLLESFDLLINKILPSELIVQAVEYEKYNSIYIIFEMHAQQEIKLDKDIFLLAKDSAESSEIYNLISAFEQEFIIERPIELLFV